MFWRTKTKTLLENPGKISSEPLRNVKKSNCVVTAELQKNATFCPLSPSWENLPIYVCKCMFGKAWVTQGYVIFAPDWFSPHTPSHLTQAVWPAVLHLILLNHKDHAHLSLQFSFYIVNKGKFVCFQLAMHALDFKTWSRHDILNLVPVEHLWYAICKKYFRLDVHFESESVNQISQLQSLLVLNGFCGKTVGKCCQGFCFHTRFSFSMWWCFLQTLPRLLRLYRVLLDHVMVLMEKRK